MTTYLKFTLFSVFLLGISSYSIAQPSLGVIWEQPENIRQAEAELAFYQNSGVSFIEVLHPVDNEIIALLDATSFTVLVRLQPEFLTVSNLIEQREDLQEYYTSALEQYQSHPNIRAYGLLNHSQISHSNFDDAFTPILQTTTVDSITSLYSFNTDKWYYLDNPEEHFAISFPSQHFSEKDLIGLNELMKSDNALVFLNSNWLEEAVNTYPEFAESIREYSENQSWQLALPYKKPNPNASFPNWLVFILLILWTGLSVQLRFLPYIRPMLFRYFLAHRFFVDDILHYRERAALGGILLMVQHAIFSGIVLFISAKMLFSPTGVDAFFYHLPALAITGSNHVSFFFIGIVLVLLTQVVALLWLHLPAKHIEHFSQTINLYAGLFFLDFILVTIMLTLYITGFGLATLMGIAILFVIIWYAAFNIAAVDMTRNLGQGRLTYLLLTMGLHAVLSIGLLTYLLTSEELMQVLELALSL